MSVVRMPFAYENCYILYSGQKRKTLSICLQSEDCNANIATYSDKCKKNLIVIVRERSDCDNLPLLILITIMEIPTLIAFARNDDL